jgi:hypothetical protein
MQQYGGGYGAGGSYGSQNPYQQNTYGEGGRGYNGAAPAPAAAAGGRYDGG